MTSEQHGQPVTDQSAGLLEDQLALLRAAFPQAFTEGKVDFDKLRAALGDQIDDRPERYTFTWAGKRDAIRLLQTPSRATLVPCREESVNFDATHHLFIEGDNLEVLKLLYKPYFGRVKMIYIDPPYNTGNDFIYRDDYADPLAAYLQLTGQADQAGNLLTSNPETSGRYHSAWLSMMYPRLFLARQLLREDGVIFVSIDDRELANLRLLMNEVFGEENFVDNIIWKKRYGGGAKEKFLVTLQDYILFYARDIQSLGNLFVPLDDESIARYYQLRDDKYETRGPYRTHPLEATKSMGDRPNLVFPIPAPDGTEVWPRRQWLWSRERVLKALAGGEIEFVRADRTWTVHTKQYLRDAESRTRKKKAFSIIDDVFSQHGTNEIIDLFGDAQVFPFPKPTRLMRSLLNIGTDSDERDIILDFFAGSGATAHAAITLNREDGGDRRLIMVQLPEPTGQDSAARNAGFPTIVDIGKERIRRVIARMKQETAGQLPLSTRDTPEDLGFRVFKLAPSHFQPWTGAAESAPAAYAQQMALFTDPLAAGWAPEPVIYEIALREGFGLNCTISPFPLGEAGVGVYRVTDPDRDQTFLISLDPTLTAETVAALNLTQDDLFICRDVALTDDLAANLALQCRLKTI